MPPIHSCFLAQVFIRSISKTSKEMGDAYDDDRMVLVTGTETVSSKSFVASNWQDIEVEGNELYY
eukprot:scaffold9277_cov130-Cylindrotheca_fusiformis.AAC.3